jgi:cytochrome c biogenesis protein CcmG, thiol:disulfide interchange protein DsbE
VSRRPAAAVAAAVALLGALAACTSAAGSPEGAGRSSADVGTTRTVLHPCPAQPDDPARGSATLPKLSFRCLGGGTLDLAKAPGAPMLVDLWGSWCGPCREELPVLQQLADTAGDRVRVVGVISKDGLPQAESFAEDAKVTFPSAFDGQGDLMAKLGLNALPVSYLVDASGALVYTQVGPVTSLDQARALVADHLGVQL